MTSNPERARPPAAGRRRSSTSPGNIKARRSTNPWRAAWERACEVLALNEALDVWFAKAEGKATIDYGFHLIVTDLPDERLPELGSMIDQGVSSFKLFMAYPGVFIVDDGTIFKAM